MKPKTVNIARRALKAAGRTVLTQAEWRRRSTYCAGDVLLTLPGRDGVFMNVGHHTPMFEHGDYERYRADGTEDELAACKVLSAAGLTVWKSLDWFQDIHGKWHAGRSGGGFYVQL